MKTPRDPIRRQRISAEAVERRKQLIVYVVCIVVIVVMIALLKS